MKQGVWIIGLNRSGSWGLDRSGSQVWIGGLDRLWVLGVDPDLKFWLAAIYIYINASGFNDIHLYVWRSFWPKRTMFGSWLAYTHVPRTQLILVRKCKSCIYWWFFKPYSFIPKPNPKTHKHGERSYLKIPKSHQHWINQWSKWLNHSFNNSWFSNESHQTPLDQFLSGISTPDPNKFGALDLVKGCPLKTADKNPPGPDDLFMIVPYLEDHPT